jgi:hypothetical protein
LNRYSNRDNEDFAAAPLFDVQFHDEKSKDSSHSFKMEPERRTSLKQLVIILLGLLVAQLGLVSSQILRLGHCPSFSALKDFEMEQVSKKIKISSA